MSFIASCYLHRLSWKKDKVGRANAKPQTQLLLGAQARMHEMNPQHYMQLTNVQTDKQYQTVATDTLTIYKNRRDIPGFNAPERYNTECDSRQRDTVGVDADSKDRGRPPLRRTKGETVTSGESGPLITDYVTHTTFGHTSRSRSPCRHVQLGLKNCPTKSSE